MVRSVTAKKDADGSSFCVGIVNIVLLNHRAQKKINTAKPGFYNRIFFFISPQWQLMIIIPPGSPSCLWLCLLEISRFWRAATDQVFQVILHKVGMLLSVLSEKSGKVTFILISHKQKVFSLSPGKSKCCIITLDNTICKFDIKMKFENEGPSIK